MALENVKNFGGKLVTGAGEVLQASVTAVKTSAVWLGRNIQAGWNNHVVPFAKAAWNRSLPYLKEFGAFLRTGNGLASVSVVGAAALHGIANKYFPGDDNAPTRAVINVIAGSLLFTAGFVAATYGGATVV